MSRLFYRILRLLPYFMRANSEGSGETAQMHRLVRLHGCTGLPEPSLVAYVISTIISWTGSYKRFTPMLIIETKVNIHKSTTDKCVIRHTCKKPSNISLSALTSKIIFPSSIIQKYSSYPRSNNIVWLKAMPVLKVSVTNTHTNAHAETLIHSLFMNNKEWMRRMNEAAPFL